ncbi:hypothetical protein CFP56_017048 [Quercus suber]|uniref:Uncharacterized protein n=1 Tax=Quercus suber TaxID=58331 RepID=A0AAW0M0R6_QUESU
MGHFYSFSFVTIIIREGDIDPEKVVSIKVLMHLYPFFIFGEHNDEKTGFSGTQGLGDQSRFLLCGYLSHESGHNI